MNLGGFLPAAALTPQDLQAIMPLALYALVALVQEFLPHMIEQRYGAILSAARPSQTWPASPSTRCSSEPSGLQRGLLRIRQQ